MAAISDIIRSKVKPMTNLVRTWLLILLAGATSLLAQQAGAPVTIRAAQVFDGRAMQRNVVVIVRGSKIERVAPAAGAVTYDLGSMTLLPGFIDTHVISAGISMRTTGGSMKENLRTRRRSMEQKTRTSR